MSPDEGKTKEQLIDELVQMRQRLAELEAAETERKEMGEALRDSEEKLRNLFESVSDGIFALDLNGIYTEVNTRMLEMHGFSSRGDLLGRSGFELVVPRDLEWAMVEMQKTLEQGSVSQVEFGACRADGSEFPVEVTGAVLKDGAGNPVGLIGITRDITERKRMGAALTESEKRFRGLANFLPLTVFEMNDKGDFTFINRQGFETFGYPIDEITEAPTRLQTTVEIFVPEDRDRVRKNRQRVLNGEDIGNVEYTAIRRDGSTFPVEVFYAPIIHAGKRTGLRGVLIDITERKKAEEELRESEERYRALVNLGATVGEAIVMLQDNERGDAMHIFVSNEWPRVTGYSRKELLGMSFSDLLHPRYREASLKRHGRKMRGEIVPGLFEMAIIRKDDTEVPIEVTSAYTTYKGERANVAFIRDITERKQAEEREKELAQELNLSSRLASIGQLAAGVAHEINNPLTGILGFSERLMRKSTAGETRRDLERIHSEAQRAARVVENLLTFARRREPKKEYLDINEILARTVELRAYELRTSNIELVPELAPSLPEIVGDFGQIQQVFLNIILNAEQAMTEANRGGKLTIRSRPGKGCIRVSFADDGPGIAAGDLDRVFNPFFTTRGERGGTGLGLSACHGVVTEHGGRIYVRSKPGQGATFVVELLTKN